MEEFEKTMWRFMTMPKLYEFHGISDINTLNKLLYIFYEEPKQVSTTGCPLLRPMWNSYFSVENETGNCLPLSNDEEIKAAYENAPGSVKGFLGSQEVLYGYDERKCFWNPSSNKGNQYWFKLQQQHSRYTNLQTLGCMPKSTGSYLLIPYHTPENGERIYADYFKDYLEYGCNNSNGNGKLTCVVSEYELRIEEDVNGLMFSLLSSLMFKSYCDIWAGPKNYLSEGMWNTFPMPLVENNRIEEIIKCGNEVREERKEARKKFPYYSLADLCNPERANKKKELKNLIEAYKALDFAVDSVFSPFHLTTGQERQKALLARLRLVRKEILQMLNTKLQKEVSDWTIKAQCWMNKIAWIEKGE